MGGFDLRRGRGSAFPDKNGGGFTDDFDGLPDERGLEVAAVLPCETWHGRARITTPRLDAERKFFSLSR